MMRTDVAPSRPHDLHDAGMSDEEGLAGALESELAAWVDMAEVVAPAWAGAHGFAYARRGRALALSLRDLPVGMFNRAFGLGDDAPVTREDIDWAVHAVPHPPVWLQPTPGPHEAASLQVLRGLGFELLPMRWAKLAKPLGPAAVEVPANDRLRVRELNAGEGVLFATTLQAAMGLPPWMAEWSARLAGREGWHLYVAEDPQDRAIACAALFMNGARAWLGMAATHAHARNRGAQRALMWRRLADAQRRGARVASTETGEPMPGQPSPSFNNMLGCGFRVCGYRTNWKAPASNS
ncbi:MAG TPA: GNAT family N-acetyltransferase [Ramlibacter sp.]|uniref:GNAT family N-acetyltransferase n=1 Tax=Ramlibacter sp. TaxID=1917967 RepID=UPI002CEE636B|nr:GNAT family N-acetyltransferase [Ramlibacter sp.]HVZ46258.1 GNAT family N-acetyltransferase [Ramlibacter sp.]